MSSFFDVEQLNLFWPLILAAVLGGLVGFEREYLGKAAGIRTNALVALGSAFFTILSVNVVDKIETIGSFDPSRIAAQIVIGIGFIGAGLIIFREDKIQNLTTATTIWVVAAIGMAVGFQFYLLAILAAIFVFILLELLSRLKKWEAKIWRGPHEKK